MNLILFKNKILTSIALISIFSTISTSYPNSISQKIVMTSMPKSGTFLLKKLLSLLSKIENHHVLYGSALITENDLLIKNKILICHAPAIAENIKLLENNHNIKSFFIYRDPRDMVCSLAHFIREGQPSMWPTYSKHELSNLISEIITDGGVWREFQLNHSSWQSNPPRNIPLWEKVWSNIEGIDSIYKFYMPWTKAKNVYSTTFEKLVGIKGGGDEKTQINEIKNIAEHLGLKTPLEKIKAVANTLFGNTNTFRKGQIGSWKEHFTEKHKEEFKKTSGQLLIDLEYEKNLNW